MEDIIERVFTDPTFITVGIILVVLITLAIFKKLFKVVVILLLVLLTYAGYLYYTGEEPPEIVKEAIEEVKKLDVEGLKEKAGNVVKDVETEVKKLTK